MAPKYIIIYLRCKVVKKKGLRAKIRTPEDGGVSSTPEGNTAQGISFDIGSGQRCLSVAPECKDILRDRS
jgi:hypothetical protein